MKKIAYLRVSTHEQSPDRQIDGLKGLCDDLRIETVSACSRRRPVYEDVLAELRSGDILIIWDLDRAYRSAKDALTELDRLRERGIDFQIANLSIDTTTPAGIFVYTIMSALAEFERRTLSQRTKEGVAAARRRGKRIGRPPKMDNAELTRAARRIKYEKESIAAIAREHGVAPWTLSRALKRKAALTQGPHP